MTLTVQFYTMLVMVGMGGWIGVTLDTHGRFLKRPTRARWVVFINDLLFWIVQGLILFYLLLLVNEGELRIYIFLAVLCGYAAYQSLLKGSYLKFLELIILTSLAIYRFVMKVGNLLLVRPIIGLIQFIFVIILGILNFLLRFVKWASQVLYSFVKIIVAPFFWILRILWNFVPHTIKNFFTKNIYKVAGFLRKSKNMFVNLTSWWKRLFK